MLALNKDIYINYYFIFYEPFTVFDKMPEVRDYVYVI